MSFIEYLKSFAHRFLHRLDPTDYIDVNAASVNIRDNIAFRGPNIIILFCAIVIASLGLNVNSIPVIIGAMLISPLMAPIVGLGMGLGTNDMTLMRYSLKNLGVMVFISLLASTLFFLISPLEPEDPSELMARTNPTIYDVLIALFGGFAGIIEMSRKEKGTVISGVAIATALMPPLCTVGYGVSCWSASTTFGALYLFFINCIFIALASYLGTKFLRFPLASENNPVARHRSRILVGIFLVVLIVPSLISAVRIIQDNQTKSTVKAFVRENRNISKSYIYDYTLHTENRPTTVELFIAGEELTPEAYNKLYRSAEAYHLTPEQITFHLDATQSNNRLTESEILKEILHANDEKIERLENERIRMQKTIDSLQSLLNEYRMAEQLREDTADTYK